MADSASGGNGAPYLFIVGLTFLVLKLTGFIGWSWWFVLLPFYFPLLFALLIFGAAFTAQYIVQRNK